MRRTSQLSRTQLDMLDRVVRAGDEGLQLTSAPSSPDRHRETQTLISLDDFVRYDGDGRFFLRLPGDDPLLPVARQLRASHNKLLRRPGLAVYIAKSDGIEVAMSLLGIPTDYELSKMPARVWLTHKPDYTSNQRRRSLALADRVQYVGNGFYDRGADGVYVRSASQAQGDVVID